MNLEINGYGWMLQGIYDKEINLAQKECFCHFFLKMTRSSKNIFSF